MNKDELYWRRVNMLKVGKRYKLLNTMDNVESDNIQLGVVVGTLIESGMEDCEGDVIGTDPIDMYLALQSGEKLPDRHYWIAYDEPTDNGCTVYGILSEYELTRLEEI